MNKYMLGIVLILVFNTIVVAQDVEVKTNTGHSKGKLNVSFNSTENLLATSGGDNQIKIWEVSSGRELKSFQREAAVEVLKFMPDPHLVGFVEYKLYKYRKFVIINVLNGETVKQFEIDANAKALKISDDGSYLATGYLNVVSLWDIKTASKVYKNEIKHDYLSFNQSNNRIAIQNKKEKSISYLDWKANAILWTKVFPLETPGASVVTNDGRTVLVMTEKPNGRTMLSKVYFLNAENGQEVKSFVVPEVNGNDFIAFSSDEKFLTIRGHNNVVKYDVATSKRLGKSYSSPVEEESIYPASITDIDILASGDAAIAYNTTVDFCNFTGEIDLQFKGGLIGYKTISLSADDRLLKGHYNWLKSTYDFSWNLTTGNSKSEKITPTYLKGFYQFSGDNSIVIHKVQSAFEIYDTPTKKKLLTIPIQGNKSLSYIQKSDDGKLMVGLSNYNSIDLYDLQLQRKLVTYSIESRNIIDADFSKDGSKLVLASAPIPKSLFCLNTNEPGPPLEIETPASRVAKFSPNGLTILAGGGNEGSGKMYLFDVETGSVVKEFKGHKMPIEAVNFSPDGKYIASGSGWFIPSTQDNSVRLWDVATGKQLQMMNDHQGAIKDVVISSDNKNVISTSVDQSIKIWDASNGKLKVTIYSVRNSNDWVAITPDNYYYASKGGASVVHFVIKDHAYTFDQFDLLFNRPDIVMERIGSAPKGIIEAYKSAYIKRLKKMGFTPDKIQEFVSGNMTKSIQAPEIILSDDIKKIRISASKTISFAAQANDPAALNLDRLHLIVNGVPVYGSKGLLISSDVPGSASLTIDDLELSNGLNVIELFVQNENGVRSLTEKIKIRYSGAKVPSKTYVISIGISDYQNNNYDLNYAAKDANDIATKFGTDASKVFRITDAHAIKEKILAVKSELMKSKVDDRVILFVAGHGLLDDNLDYFIGMHDVDFENPSVRGLPYEDLEGLLDGIPARKKIMFIDACHSGEVDKDDAVIAGSTSPKFQTLAKLDAGTTIASRGFKTIASKSEGLGLQNSFELMQQLFADLRKGTGAVVISSASGAEFALESDAWKNGVFTYSILEGLENRKCDADKNGTVEVSELKNYVFDRVSELTHGKQHPTSRRENLEFDFVVW